MASKIKLTLKNPGFLIGVQGIHFILDGEFQAEMQFGESREFETAPGEHVAQLILYGMAERSSKELRFSLKEGQHAAIEGKYSRLWGNIKMKLL